LELFFKAIISPFWAVFFIMISVAVFYHGAIGMKIILEDYVHSVIWRKIMINCVFLLSFFMIGIFSLTVITINIKYLFANMGTYKSGTSSDKKFIHIILIFFLI
jgi:hypothetical protein